MSTDTALPEASCPGAPWSHTRPLAWPGCATGRDYVSTCQNELGTISLGLLLDVSTKRPARAVADPRTYEQQRIRPTVASAGRIPRTCTRDASSTPSLLPAALSSRETQLPQRQGHEINYALCHSRSPAERSAISSYMILNALFSLNVLAKESGMHISPMTQVRAIIHHRSVGWHCSVQ